eukprot:SAG11_NODE_21_length_25065_cov_3.589081_8_plen_101_part_00
MYETHYFWVVTSTVIQSQHLAAPVVVRKEGRFAALCNGTGSGGPGENTLYCVAHFWPRHSNWYSNNGFDSALPASLQIYINSLVCLVIFRRSIIIALALV